MLIILCLERTLSAICVMLSLVLIKACYVCTDDTVLYCKVYCNVSLDIEYILCIIEGRIFVKDGFDKELYGSVDELREKIMWRSNGKLLV